MLMFFKVSNLFTASFYTISTACLVWMVPYLVTTTNSWLLVFITVAEVFGLLGQVIFVTKEQVEEKEEMDEESNRPPCDRGGTTTGCGVYTVRRRVGKEQMDFW